ncbi:MAG: tetratricopeptide repeat protein [Leptolyngbyaceae cyanobacterium CSU_1_3]|nr:tetratricopeptide repeat protein [Leptolyngbyaceae cyanobacterium CSU_1_3]
MEKAESEIQSSNSNKLTNPKSKIKNQKLEILDGSIKDHFFDRFDWIWNTLTVTCLVFTTGCVIAILQPFVIGGLTVAEASAMIAQGAGITFVSKGALTKDGKVGVQNLLMKLGIASRWYSEVTFVASVLLLLLTAGLHASLPKLGEVYLQQGQDYRERGLLGEARRKYEKALELNPRKAATHIALGELDESLKDLESAESHYKQAIVEGNRLAFDRLGRTYLAREKPTEAETILRLGIRWTQDNAELQFSLNRNLGRALLEQKKYAEAQPFLNAAIARQQELPTAIAGRGMANCFLSQVSQSQGNQTRVLQQLNICRQIARPETVDEYQWLINAGLHDVTEKADTTAIVNSDTPVDR